MNYQDLEASLIRTVQAHTPLCYVETIEDRRLYQLVHSLCHRVQASLCVWTSTRGLRRLEAQGTGSRLVEMSGANVPSGQASLRTLIEAIWANRELNGDDAASLPYVILATDAVGPAELDAFTMRLLKDLHWKWRRASRPMTLVLGGYGWNVPSSLAGYVSSMRLDLPTASEIEAFVQERPEYSGVAVSPATFASRAGGLSLLTVEGMVRRLGVSGTAEDPLRLIDDVKREEVRNTGLLEVVSSRGGRERHDDSSPPPRLGGFRGFKEWFGPRREFLKSDDSRRTLRPKGVLLLGFPGCGKSLAARWVAEELGVMLVQMDLGRLQDRYVGSSEARMRQSIATIEAAAPLVLFIDEIEKAIAGFGADNSGVTTRMVGQLLTWLNDHRAQVFVVATCNRADLPPELTRAGRFDASFVVRPPTSPERREILAAAGQELGLYPLADNVLDAAVGITGPDRAGFSGAELRQLLVEAAYIAGPNRFNLTEDDIRRAHGSVKPLALTTKGTVLLADYDRLVREGMLEAGGSE